MASPAVLPIPRLPSLAGVAGRLLPTLGLAIPGISISIPSLGDIWEGLLRAVPKNKVSHSRKRMRQLANKGLKDVNSLCQCPACGAPKRMHRLCQRCLEGMSIVNQKIYRQPAATDHVHDRNERHVARQRPSKQMTSQQPTGIRVLMERTSVSKSHVYLTPAKGCIHTAFWLF